MPSIRSMVSDTNHGQALNTLFSASQFFQFHLFFLGSLCLQFIQGRAVAVDFIGVQFRAKRTQYGHDFANAQIRYLAQFQLGDGASADPKKLDTYSTLGGQFTA